MAGDGEVDAERGRLRPDCSLLVMIDVDEVVLLACCVVAALSSRAAAEVIFMLVFDVLYRWG